MAKEQNYPHLHLEGSLFSEDFLSDLESGNALFTSENDFYLDIDLSRAIDLSYQTLSSYFSSFDQKRNNENVDKKKITREFIINILKKCFDWEQIAYVKGEDGYPITYKAYSDIALSYCPYSMSLDERCEDYQFGKEKQKRSVFQMQQAYLSQKGKSEWGVVSNGLSLRLLRSSTMLQRPQYLEFDLYGIIKEDSYREFKLLYLILHSSRLYNRNEKTKLQVWEEWREAVITGGERVRNGLQEGVTEALIILGNGFLKEESNTELREALTEGYTSKDLYHDLLRLVYRFIFLFVTEERMSSEGKRLLLLQDEKYEKERELYDKGYSLTRLRQRMQKRVNYNEYYDLWETEKVVINALARGEEKLALPALGGLFDEVYCSRLMSSRLTNESFLSALKSLRWRIKDGSSFYIDYKNLGTEELGSIYEKLLEYVPVVDFSDSSRCPFSFKNLSNSKDNKGNARKTSASYYTPRFLVEDLINSALVPEINKALKGKESDKEKEEALLSLSVVDPSCGSGHFLLRAAETIAVELTHVREKGETPEGYRKAIRDTIRECIYGVDLNPMAVEITKMALWLESFEPGKPLGFLSSHIKCGNSLLGLFDISVVYKGIPNAAYGEKNKTCLDLKKKNSDYLKERKDRTNDTTGELFLAQEEKEDFSILDTLPEDTLEDVKIKEELYLENEKKISRERKAADTYMGTFLMKKEEGNQSSEDKTASIPTTVEINSILEGIKLIDKAEKSVSNALKVAKDMKVFHWQEEFKSVFNKGGFDCVLGNPPWDVVQMDDKEFFAQTYPEIANEDNSAKRKELIDKLKTSEDPFERELYKKYKEEIGSLSRQSWFYGSEEYPISGNGKINLYGVFSELFYKLKKKTGHAGLIVPSGIATDENASRIFSYFSHRHQVVSLYDFENKGIFPDVHGSFKFCLFTLGPSEKSDYAFFLHTIKEKEDERRHFTLTDEEIALINPNTHSLLTSKAKRDLELIKKIYLCSLPLIKDKTEDNGEGNPWKITCSTMLNMSTASALFLDFPTPDSLPLYESKMMHIFDHRWGSYEGKDNSGNNLPLVPLKDKENPKYEVTPHYWIKKKEVYYRIATLLALCPKEVLKEWKDGTEYALRQAVNISAGDEEIHNLADSPSLFEDVERVIVSRSPKYLMGWRGLTRATDSRTTISAALPVSGVGNSMNLFYSSNPNALILILNLNSIVFDFVARNKMGGTNFNMFYMKQMPIIPPSSYTEKEIEWLMSIAYRLMGTTKLMASSLGCAVTIYNEEERFELRGLIDAYYAYKYGLSREDLEYILDSKSVMGPDYPSETFPTLKKNEIEEYGEYKTKRMALESYDKIMRYIRDNNG